MPSSIHLPSGWSPPSDSHPAGETPRFFLQVARAARPAQAGQGRLRLVEWLQDETGGTTGAHHFFGGYVPHELCWVKSYLSSGAQGLNENICWVEVAKFSKFSGISFINPCFLTFVVRVGLSLKRCNKGISRSDGGIASRLEPITSNKKLHS